MRLFPIALIVIGSLGLAKHLGLIPIGVFHLIGPVLLIAAGVALLVVAVTQIEPPPCGPESPDHVSNPGSLLSGMV